MNPHPRPPKRTRKRPAAAAASTTEKSTVQRAEKVLPPLTQHPPKPLLLEGALPWQMSR